MICIGRTAIISIPTSKSRGVLQDGHNHLFDVTLILMANEKSAVLFLFRRDLRLRDNPALRWATQQQKTVICAFIYDKNQTEWALGEASQWWLHHSLVALAKDIKAAGNCLRIYCGDTEATIDKMIRHFDVNAIAWNRRYEADSISLDKKLKAKYTELGIEVKTTPGNLNHEPWKVTREKQQPYKVFTAYWRASLKHESLPLTATVRKIPASDKVCSDERSLESLKLLPTIPWDRDFPDYWAPGEAGAANNLATLLKSTISDYDPGRDIPAVNGTSQLSPHLAFGEITPRQINAAVAKKISNKTLAADDNIETFLKEIAWREFAYHLMYHFPHTSDQPLDSRFAKFPWKKVKPELLKRWQQGNTGIPMVDAGMRQLWQTGWMHNRVRMVVGSLLIKNMGYHWLEGAHWFWDTLLDADLASNSMGWQWVAGSGADAAPYFRVFNPVRQGERFDPEGEYVRHWVPEIAELPKKYIHSPWTADSTVLKQAGIILGKTYPKPIVDLKATRVTALERFAKIKTPVKEN